MSAPRGPSEPQGAEGFPGLVSGSQTSGPQGADSAEKRGPDSADATSAESRPGPSDNGSVPPWQRKAAPSTQTGPSGPAAPGPASSGPAGSGPAGSSSGSAGGAPAQPSPSVNKPAAGASSQQSGGAPSGPSSSANPVRPTPARPSSAGPVYPPTGQPGAYQPSSRPVITGDAAPKQTSRPAPTIDAPTRNISREQLPSDMPDLSGLSHPQPGQAGHAAPSYVGPDAVQPVPTEPGDKRVFTVGNRVRGPIRASLQIRRIDPWSTLKLSLVLSIALFFVWMVAVGLLYLILAGMGVWDRLNSAFSDTVSSSGGGDGLVSATSIFGGAALIGVVNIILFTALATIGAFIYNLSSDMVGGVEVTLADRD